MTEKEPTTPPVVPPPVEGTPGAPPAAAAPLEPAPFEGELETPPWEQPASTNTSTAKASKQAPFESLAAETDIANLSPDDPDLAPTRREQLGKDVSFLRSAATGFIKGAIDEPANLLSAWFGDVGGIVIDKDGVRFGSDKEIAAKNKEALALPKDAGVVEHAVHGISQFVGAWALAGKFVGPAKGFLGFTGKGALADVIGFDPKEGKIADLVEANPSIANPVTAFLKADPKDPDALNRFKRALEGAAIGGVMEAVLRLAIPVVKRVASSATDTDKARILAEESEKLATAQKLADMNPYEAMAAVKAANDAAAIPSVAYDAEATFLENITKLMKGETHPPRETPDLSIAKTGELSLGKPVIPNVKEGGFWPEPGVIAPKNPNVNEFGRAAGPNEPTLHGLVTREAGVPAPPKPAVKVPDEWPVERIHPEYVSVPPAPGKAAASAKPATKAATEAAPAAKPVAGAKPSAPAQPAIRAVATPTDEQAEQIARSIAAGNDASTDTFPGQMLFNWAKFNSTDEADAALRVTAEKIGARLDKVAQPGTYTFEQIRNRAASELADMADGQAHSIMSRFTATAVGMKQAISQMVAMKMAIREVSQEVAKRARAIDFGTASDIQKAELFQLVSHLMNLTAVTKGVQTSAARMTAAGRIQLGEEGIPALIETLKKQKNDTALRDLAAKLQMLDGDPKAIVRTITTAGTPMEIHNMIWRSLLLMNFRTQIVNATSGLLNATVMPLERLLGGVSRGVLRGDLGEAVVNAREALVQYSGMAQNIRDSGRAAWKVLKSRDGSPIGDAVTKTERADIAPSVKLLREGIDDNGAFSTIFRWAHLFIQSPYRLMATSDEFFKQLTYRGKLTSQLWREGFDQGLSGRALAEHVARKFDEGFAPSGRFTNEHAQQYAREVTFTEKPGPITNAFQTFTHQAPVFQLLLPFVRTPGNIMRRTFEMTPPVAALSRRVREDVLGKNGVEAQTKTMGRMAFGTMVWWWAIDKAISGDIIGGGPGINIQQQRRIQATKTLAGEVPYSFVHRNADGSVAGTTQFNRYDSFAAILGMAADFVALNRARGSNAADADLAAMGVLAVMQNLLNKSYLKGLADFMEGLDNKDQLERYAKNHVSSYVPGALAQGAELLGLGDTMMRETRGWFDGAMARAPGLSETMKPKLNQWTGEPIPVRTGALLPDPISPLLSGASAGKHPALLELARIQYPTTPLHDYVGHVKMTEDQKHRFIQLYATPPGRKPLLEAISHYMKSPHYQRSKDLDADQYRYMGETHPAHDKIQQITQDYRARALQLLGKEFPEFRTDQQTDKRNKKAAEAGKLDRVKELLQPKKK